MKNNKGFSLIELIAVIGIISVLTGLLTPLFLKYVEQNKEKACRQNREAILNIYEKGVYAGNFTVDEAILDNLMANDGSVSEEFETQAELYLVCPGSKSKGYTAKLTGSGKVMEIECPYHGTDEVSVDFIGWTGSGNEDKNDPGFTVPGVTTTPVPTDGPEATTTPTPTVAYIDTGVWPYVADNNGNMDERWVTAENSSGQIVGPVPGAHVYIPLPERAHFIASKSQNEYVIVTTYGNKSGCYQVNYEWSDGPESIDKNGWEVCVLASGVKYDTETNPPSYLYGGTTQCIAAYGDMVTVHLSDGTTRTFIQASMNTSGVVDMPSKLDAAYGENAGGNWYYVPPLYTGTSSN